MIISRVIWDQFRPLYGSAEHPKLHWHLERLETMALVLRNSHILLPGSPQLEQVILVRAMAGSSYMPPSTMPGLFQEPNFFRPHVGGQGIQEDEGPVPLSTSVGSTRPSNFADVTSLEILNIDNAINFPCTFCDLCLAMYQREDK